MPLRYESYLERELEFRQSRNLGYSLRAYARDLGISAPKLSQILRGKAGISPVKACEVARKLNLNQNEAEHFVCLVTSRHARSPRARKCAKEKLKTLGTGASYGSLSEDAFRVISDWYHFAILELTDTVSFQSNTRHVSERLGITEAQAQAAIVRLHDLGLLETKNGKWRQTHAHLATPSGIPSDAIRRYHRQVLAQADAALERVSLSRRDFSALTLPLAPEDLAEAQAELKKIRRKLAERFAKNGRPKDRVYCFSLQLFPFDREV